ncbi:hypothetical protein AHF37_11459 [Paragonimus kellicotti]|nr:hypothetical protein AHF37_11459 [Paragonimus kellicotti]
MCFFIVKTSIDFTQVTVFCVYRPFVTFWDFNCIDININDTELRNWRTNRVCVCDNIFLIRQTLVIQNMHGTCLIHFLYQYVRIITLHERNCF